MKKLFVIDCVCLLLILCTTLTSSIPTKDGGVKSKAITVKTDDTSSEPGSGDDDEDLGKGVVVKKVNMTETFEGSGEPLDKVEGSGEADDNEGSGEGGSGVRPTEGIVTTVSTTADSIFKITTEKPMETTTKERLLKSKKPVVATEFIDNSVNDNVYTEKSPRKLTTDIIKDINVSPTTEGMEKNMPGSHTALHPNAVREGLRQPGKTLQQKGTDGGQSETKGLSFTVGIVIGVVIGAILAILIILFLVYRLRKKDEGSYSLDEPITGYQRHDSPGSPLSEKEYYA